MKTSEIVIRLAAQQMGVPTKTIKPSSQFVSDLRFDSLDQIEFIMATEDEFQINIDDEAAVKCLSIEEYVSMIQRGIDAKAN